jgi:HD superfamily phosphodiesterase
MVLLAMARLLHGAYAAGIEFTDKDINIGLISALMHDTGYIQSQDDLSGTGAKYTLIHIQRSIIFFQNYYAQEKYFAEDLNNFSDIIYCTDVKTQMGNIKFSSPKIELLGKILATADLLGQMADRLYLEKLVFLFQEFEEAKVPGFESELDLLKKTVNFYKKTKQMFANDLGNVNRYMINHFKERWNIEKDLYDETIENNINYLKYILKSNYKNIHTRLRRNAITIQ